MYTLILAGIGTRGLACETKLSVDENLMKVNYFGPVALTKAVVRINPFKKNFKNLVLGQD